jgi:hypothetical protein
VHRAEQADQQGLAAAAMHQALLVCLFCPVHQRYLVCLALGRLFDLSL